MVTPFKTIYKNHERKTRSESRDIDENDIVQWLGDTFGIFRRLAAEWRRHAFVYTSRYLDDIFTIDNPEFEKHIYDIYPAELQLNKAITSDKETSFLDLNIKVIGSDIHTSVYDKRDDFGFPIVISHGWVVTFQDSHRTVFTFRSWLDLLGVVLAFWISILKISKLLQNCSHRVVDITSFEKHLKSSLDHTLNFCRNLVIFRSKNICQKESLTRSSTVI